MGINFKKLLPSSMQSTKWGDLALVVQSVYNDFKTQKIDIIKQQFQKENMTSDDIDEMAYRMGFTLLSFDGYTSTEDFLKKEVMTIAKRILWKTTRTGYKYIYYIFNLVGDAYPILYTPTKTFEVLDGYWDSVSIETTQYFLDPTPADTLDSTSGLWISNLDQTVSAANTILRHYVLSFKPKFIETTTEFMSLNTLKVLLNDVKQAKRATEIPYFEYRLEFDVNIDKTLTTKTFTSYDQTLTATQKSILIGTANMTLADSIQFGSGAHTTIDGSITGVQSPISIGGNLATEADADSGGDDVNFSKTKAFDKNPYWITSELTSGYQRWGFTIAKDITDPSGLANNSTVYTATITIDGIVNNISIIGSNAQYMSTVLNEIRKDLTNGIIEWDSSLNGFIKVKSLTTGTLSTVVIADTNLFSSLANITTVEPAVDGVDTTSSWKSSQTGSSISGVAWLGQKNIGSNAVISKIRLKNGNNIYNNVSSVIAQWKLSTGSWSTPGDVNTLGTYTLSTAVNVWNDLTIPAFVPSGDYDIRVLANANLNTGYAWQLMEMEISCTNLVSDEWQIIESLDLYKFYVRRVIKEKNKLSAITELAIKDASGNCLLYSTFPKIQWDEKMYGNILLDITLV